MPRTKTSKITAKPEDNELPNEKILLDEVSKLVFDPLAPMAIYWINWMFGENYKGEDITIEHGKTEYFDANFNLTRSDLSFVVINKKTNKRTKYHVEVQTEKDGSMVIRMYAYGVQIALDTAPDKDGIIDMPKQRVIYLEENNSITDKLQQKFRYEDGTIVDYTVPIIRNWKLGIEEIQASKIYPFLALQLNNHRKALKKAQQQNNIAKKRILAKKLAEDSERLAQVSANLYQTHQLTDKDFTAILNGIMYMNGHLNRVYLNDKELEEGVNKMTKLVIDENIRKDGIRSSIELLAEVGIPKDDVVEKIQQKYALESKNAQEYVDKYYPNN